MSQTDRSSPEKTQEDVAQDDQVTFRNVDMAFGSRRVFEALSCSFPSGRISVILGGSGSGKSTLLRLIGGLVHPQAGRIEVDASREGDVLRVQVRDDGAGLQPGLSTGVGLTNVREQLAARYGTRAAFALASAAGGRGVCAEIRVPLGSMA